MDCTLRHKSPPSVSPVQVPGDFRIGEDVYYIGQSGGWRAEHGDRLEYGMLGMVVGAAPGAPTKISVKFYENRTHNFACLTSNLSRSMPVQDTTPLQPGKGAGYASQDAPTAPTSTPFAAPGNNHCYYSLAAPTPLAKRAQLD